MSRGAIKGFGDPRLKGMIKALNPRRCDLICKDSLTEKEQDELNALQDAVAALVTLSVGGPLKIPDELARMFMDRVECDGCGQGHWCMATLKDRTS